MFTSHSWKPSMDWITSSISFLLLLFSHKLCPTLWDNMDCSTQRLPSASLSPGICSDSCALNQWCYLTFSHPPQPPSPPALNLTQHQGLFPMSRLVSFWNFGLQSGSWRHGSGMAFKCLNLRSNTWHTSGISANVTAREAENAEKHLEVGRNSGFCIRV